MFLFLKITLLAYIMPTVLALVLTLLGLNEEVQRRFFLTAPMFNVIVVVFLVWLASLFYLIGSWIYSIGKKLQLCVANEEVEDEALLKAFEEWKERLHIRGKVSLYYNFLLTSPAIIYCGGYQILIPRDIVREDDYDYALAHELMHFKQKDIVWKNIGISTAMLNAANPLLYLMNHKFRDWCEVACDFKVCEAGKELFTRKEYYDHLIAMKERSQEYYLLDGLCCLYEEDKPLTKRFFWMKRNQHDIRKSVVTAVASVAGILLVASMIGSYVVVAKGMLAWENHTHGEDPVNGTELLEGDVEFQEADYEIVSEEEFFDGCEEIYRSRPTLGTNVVNGFTIDPGDIWCVEIPTRKGCYLSINAYLVRNCEVAYQKENGDMVRFYLDASPCWISEIIVEEIDCLYIKYTGEKRTEVEFQIIRNRKVASMDYYKEFLR